MDEADILADRKAILSHGVVRCVGTSLFLKTRFGVGYNLSIAKAPHCDPKAVTEFITHGIDVASQTRHIAGEMAFSLPYTATKEFGSFFESLNENQDKLGIMSYGLSMTTLEEVFLKFQDDLEEFNEASHPHGSESSTDMTIQEQADAIDTAWHMTYRPSPASAFTKVYSLTIAVIIWLCCNRSGI